MSESKKSPAGIDPRGPRFGAAITSVLLLVTVFLALDAATLPSAFALLIAITALFLWGAIFGPANHPYGFIFKKLVRPALKAPTELEDPRAPQFAQGVGFFVAAVGLALYAVGIEGGLVYAAAAAFVAAFLNAVFAFCLGCQIYIGLKRVGVIRSA